MRTFPATKTLSLTERDSKRLAPHLISTRRLNEVLVMDSVSDEDLRRMVLIEAKRSMPRPTVVRKLLGRIHARQRKEILALVFPNAN